MSSRTTITFCDDFDKTVIKLFQYEEDTHLQIDQPGETYKTFIFKNTDHETVRSTLIRKLEVTREEQQL